MGLWNVRWTGVLPAGPPRCSTLRTEAAPFTIGQVCHPKLDGRGVALREFGIGLPKGLPSGGLLPSGLSVGTPGVLASRWHDPLSVDPFEDEPDLPAPKPRIEPRMSGPGTGVPRTSALVAVRSAIGAQGGVAPALEPEVATALKRAAAATNPHPEPSEDSGERQHVRLRVTYASFASAEQALHAIDLTRFADCTADLAAAWLALSGFSAQGPFAVSRLAK